MKRVIIKWFHILKGIGEGVTDTGELVLLKLTAVKPSGEIPTLQVGQVIGCEIKKHKGSLVAKSIDVHAFLEAKKPEKKTRPHLRIIEASR
jgi:cold shock CspA family protein